VEQLERQAGRNSSTSSRPPSSDSPYKKKGRDRSLRERGKRRPGRQPGDPGTMLLVDDPNERLEFPPSACRGCIADLAAEPVAVQRRHQVTDIARPAADGDRVRGAGQAVPVLRDGHRGRAAPARTGAGQLRAGDLRVGREPDLRAPHPISSTTLLCQLAGTAVSMGWMAGIRGKAAALVEASGFMQRVRELLKAASGLAANLYRRTATAKAARRIARRFLSFEDLILRFVTHPDLDIFTNNEAERTIRPAKVQQRSSGGCWRTFRGLADFAMIQSYLSAAAKWASANSTLSVTSSTATHDSHPAGNRPDNAIPHPHHSMPMTLAE
jgi:Family of unknown function (DUF6444)/Transposase IS66 family